MACLRYTRLACLALIGVACVAALPSSGGSRAAQDDDDEENLYRLPDGFMFGAGTSAYQMEGAWDADGKGVNIYDADYHSRNDTAADVTCDSYHRYKEDFALAAEMKLDVFRFSISWARIFPNGRRTQVEPRGVKHYHDVIDELVRLGIEPQVTINHFDFPQVLEDEFKGWYSEKMIDIYVDFADFIFNEYGSKVRYWVTLNEPNMHCQMMPTATRSDQDYYTCVHNEIRAHAKAYRLYQQKYAATQKGLVGIGAVSFFSRPNSTETDDIAAAQRANMFDLGFMLHPLVFGDYPVVMRTVLGSMLPAFAEQETRELLPGAVDFVGVNCYSGYTIADAAKNHGNMWNWDLPMPPPPSRAGRLALGGGSRAGPLAGPPHGINITVTRFSRGPGDLSDTWVLADLSVWIRETYGDRVGIFITENGVMHGEESLDDYNAKAPHLSYTLRNLLKVTNRYGLRVLGYIYWSFIDGFEYMGELKSYRGIVKVDFDSGSLNRTLRTSSEYFKTVATTRRVPLVEPRSTNSRNSGNHSTAPLCVLLGTLVARVLRWI